MENQVVVLKSTDIKDAVKRCNPKIIAVAYLGYDWKEYINDPDNIDYMIISPTIGSNPYAITELAKTIGWEKVYFLEELHAKVYVGSRTAIVGSANLTKNGLSGQALLELCVEITNEDNIDEIIKFTNELREKANSKYNSTNDKKSKVSELVRLWSAATSSEIIKDQSNLISFEEFELLAKDHFYVVWWQEDELEYTDELNQLQSKIEDAMSFLPSDSVLENKWALCWRITNKNLPDKRKGMIYWLYIHDVYEDGIDGQEYAYKKVAIQRNDLQAPHPPFEITPSIEMAFKKAVVENGISEYLIQESRELFSLDYSINGIPKLLERMKYYLANQALRRTC